MIAYQIDSVMRRMKRSRAGSHWISESHYAYLLYLIGSVNRKTGLVPVLVLVLALVLLLISESHYAYLLYLVYLLYIFCLLYLLNRFGKEKNIRQ